jgi:hypothetical protein
MAPNIDHLAINARLLRGLKLKLDRALRAARMAHTRAHGFYLVGSFDGGKMRNLDDLVMFLEDARKEVKEYLKNE